MAKDKSKKKDKAESNEGVSSVDDNLISDPSSSNGDSWAFNKEALGELVAIKVEKVERDFKTSAGVSDVVRAKTVIVVNEKKPAKSESHDDVLVFGKVLLGALSEFAGKGWVVGRLEKGEAQPGKSAPYILTTADDDEKASAIEAIKAL
jgi:hypothetical protein